MQQYFNIKNARFQETPDKESADLCVYVSPDADDRRELTEVRNLDEHTLNSALDPDELSRIEIEDNYIAVIFKCPRNYTSADNFLFRVSSIGLFLFDNKLLAITNDDIGFFSLGKDVSNITGGIHELLIRFIARSVSQFLGHIRAISLIVDELEKKLETSMNNKHLMHLFRLSQSMTYYLSAISANGVLIEKLRTYSGKIGFTAEHLERLEDLNIDNTQCYKQAEIYSAILTSMSDARASVMNNNLNMMMKRLTVLSTVFMPLNVIAGVFGMSEYTEFTKDYLNPVAAYTLFMFGLAGVGCLMYWILHRTGLD
ncbi:magnesium transporter [Planctomycetales bacterium]|nr:magnesium transporter [Planctomycetales bacterium]